MVQVTEKRYHLELTYNTTNFLNQNVIPNTLFTSRINTFWQTENRKIYWIKRKGGYHYIEVRMLVNHFFFRKGNQLKVCTKVLFRPTTLNCDISKLVYLLFCYKWQEDNYVWGTGTEFWHRFNNYRKTIKNNNNKTPWK